jgi:anti-sigma factor RsiW
MTQPAVTCRQVVELVSDYLDDTLEPDLRGSVEEHLSACPGCLEYLTQMRVTIGSLRDVEPESLEPSVVSQLVAAFADVTGNSSHRPPEASGR